MNEEEIKQNIYSQYKKYFEANDYLLQLADNLFKAQAQIGVIHKEPNEIVVAFFAKGYKTFRSIQILCKEGFGIDAAILLRSLLELLITLFYILKKPKERVKLYLEHDNITVKRYLDAVKIHKTGFAKDVNITKERRNEIIQNYNKIKTNYPDKNRWANKSTRKMAEEVGLKAQYDLIYSLLCNLAHPSPRGFNEYLGEAENGGLLVDINPNDSYIEQVLPSSYAYFFGILEQFNKQFKLGQGDKIKEAKEKMLKFKKN